jgi:prepilin-type N-terminal cleavage/methylation domain-containing protein
MKKLQGNHGFTLFEILLALLVSGIILAAVATLAYAMGSANDLTDDTDSKEAQVRYTTMRVRELIRNAKMIGGVCSNQIGIWRADDNNDCQINSNEVVLIITSTTKTGLKLYQYDFASFLINPTQLGSTNIQSTMAINHLTPIQTLLLPDAVNVTFTADKPTTPMSKIVTIAFDIPINGITRHYEVTASVESPAWNMLLSTNALAAKGNCGW